MNKKYVLFIVAILTVASFAAFGRIASNEFVNFDDNLYITEIFTLNPALILRISNGHSRRLS